MTSEPYASARTVYWIVDNGSSHAGRASIERPEGAWQNLRVIHLPIHACWLNQIDLYFSIVQRKALSPNSFDSLDELADRLLRFGEHYRRIARPFDWTFSRAAACSPRSPSASHGLRLQRDGPRSRGPLAAQGRCQRALTIFHPSRVRTRCRYST